MMTIGSVIMERQEKFILIVLKIFLAFMTILSYEFQSLFITQMEEISRKKEKTKTRVLITISTSIQFIT